ncbi:MAG: GIY-YIG nuclease family protein [Candidatus Roizmanbacteria bacterium]|nr:GIY-YIG nuclease family protein [Candidatus Roizmanbacteria bacterium]
MILYYVYIVQSLKDNNLYIGCSDNWERRLEEHNGGKNFSTKSRRPFRLIYLEAFVDQEEAFKKEKFYKSGRGHEVLYKMLFNTLSTKADGSK